MNPDCPWWQGPSPRALDLKWDRVLASTGERHQRAVAFRVVQPWGRDKARESTLVSEHATAEDAFAHIDQLSAQMVRTGAPSDGVELIVVDQNDTIVMRRGLN